MFNYNIYRISQKESKTPSVNNLFQDLRNNEGLNAAPFMEKYYSYLLNNMNVSEDNEDVIGHAMDFSSYLAQFPKIILPLERLYNEVKGHNIDVIFLKYLYSNFDMALLSYVKNNFKDISNGKYNEYEFGKLSDIAAISYLNSNKSSFILNNGFNANQIANWFNKMLDDVSFVINNIGNINSGFWVIENFINAEPYIMPLVYHKRKSNKLTQIQRQQDINTKILANIIIEYINQTGESNLLNFLDYAEIFLDYVSTRQENLIYYLRNLTEINDENYNFSDLKRIVWRAEWPESHPEWGIKEEDINLNSNKRFKNLSKINLDESYDAEEGKSKKSLKFPSKYFEDFGLGNSSNNEKMFFNKLEKLGLHAIPTNQRGQINIIDEENNKIGFRIDFLLPCNVREYNGENYKLKQDIIFIGEYFGFYGEKYEEKKKKKINWQNNFEQNLDQKCVHLSPDSDICAVLVEKNIDSKCYPDFNGFLVDVKSIDQKKLFYIKSHMQNFIYSFLVNELLWQINYNYNLNNTDNFNKVKEKNKEYLDRYEYLLKNYYYHDISYIVDECESIIDDYKKTYKKDQYHNRRITLSKTYNNRKNPSI
jgi:hypothetical protein